MKKELLELALDQINFEFESSYLYLSMSAWAQDNGFPGTAKWMDKQAGEEISHGKKMMHFLQEVNQKVLLTKCIKKYTIKGDKTMLLTSSDLNFLAASCDKIIVLDDKGIAESGTHRIITAEFIKKYFNIEAVVTKNIYSGLPEIQVIEEG